MWFFKRPKPLERSETLKALEEVLLKARNRDPKKYGSDEDEDIVIDAYNALSEIEKKAYFELIPYLYEFAKDRDEYLRQRAVEAFYGFEYEQISEFKDIAYEMWNSKKEDDDVRFTALGVWYTFYQNTRDPLALKILYSLSKNRDYDSGFRGRAIKGMMEVIGDVQRFIKANNQWYQIPYNTDSDKFEALIDWKDLEDIMRKYAPDALDS